MHKLYLYFWCTLFCLCGTTLNTFSQTLPPNACGTDVYHQRLYRSDQRYQQSFDNLNEELYEIISRQMHENSEAGGRNGNSCKQVVTIPVVVHIMHLPSDGTPDNNTSNITDARVQAGIDHLNDAFRNRGNYSGGPYHTNAGVQSVDVEIEFVLAKRTPNGNTTNGIVRVPTLYSNLFKDDPCGAGTEDGCLKALSIWDPTRYMNVWLVNEICETRANNPGSCWIGGYAFYANSHGQSYDGIVNEARFWGANPDDSKLHIHEVGHYFNLFHTFQAGNCVNDDCLIDGDRVCDTPPDVDGEIFTSCNSPNPSFRTANSCSTDANDASSNNPFNSDVQDMYENYMDYGYWVCQNTFTQGQKDRMRAALFGIRSSLLESNGSIPVNSALDAGIQQISQPRNLVCGASFNPVINVKNFGLNPITSLIIQSELDGATIGSSNWSGNLQPGQSINITLNSVNSSFEGTHTFKTVIADANNIGKDSYTGNDEACTDYSYLPSNFVTTLPYCIDVESNPLFPAGWAKQNPYATSLWKGYSGITNCSDNGNGALYLDTWGNTRIELASEDALMSTVIDLTNYATAELSYDWAYIRSFAPLSLEVEVSTDCGQSFTSLASKDDINLASTGGFAYGSLWTPTNCGDWDSETLNLTPYVGQKIILQFRVSYTASAAYSQRLYLDNICVDGFLNVVLPCNPPTDIPQAMGIYTADESCTDGQGWTHFWKKAATSPATSSDVLLLSIQQDATMELTPNQVKLGITNQYGNNGHDLSAAPYVSNTDGWFVMGRYFDVSPTIQPSSPVAVRFYYDNTDFQDVQQAVANSAAAGNLTSHDKLVFYKISQVDPNPDANQHNNVVPANYKQFLHDPTPSGTRWTYANMGAHHRAEFMVNNFSGGGGGSNGLGDASGVFPVEFIDFNGKIVGETIELSWTTASEINNDRFEIERVENGKFGRIGIEKGQGTTQEVQKYWHRDLKPLVGNNVYRLKQIDLDGKYQYSSSIEVFFEREIGLLVYPNPSGSQVSFQFGKLYRNEAQIRIFDLAGKLLKIAQWSPQKNAIYKLNLSTFTHGAYMYEVTIGSTVYRGKVMKL